MIPETLFQYFPNLSGIQRDQFRALEALYKDWNTKINVVSRKDIDELYLRHVLHSLGIAKVYEFQPGEQVLDVGTGGGFPGIPLAILFPILSLPWWMLSERKSGWSRKLWPAWSSPMFRPGRQGLRT